MVGFGRGIDCGLCCCGLFLVYVFGADGRVCDVDRLCATEPPFSSGNTFGNSGAALLAQALEKNTTLRELDLGSEFVVMLRVLGGGLIVIYVVVGCFWFWFLGRRGVCVVLIVCAPLNRLFHQTINWTMWALHRWRKL